LFPPTYIALKGKRFDDTDTIKEDKMKHLYDYSETLILKMFPTNSRNTGIRVWVQKETILKGINYLLL
jgi:hypothetical protein